MSTWIGIPFLSAFLFVMGGILVGHLLWYRDRSRDMQAIKEAESKYNKAKAAARDRKHQFIELSRNSQSFEQQCEDYRNEIDSLRQALASQKQHSESLETEMGKLQAEHSRFELACRDAQQQRDAALDQAEDNATELDKVRALLKDTEAKFEASATQMGELASTATAAGTQINDLQTRCDQLSHKNEQLEQEIRTLSGQLEASQQRHTTSEEERDQLASQRDEKVAELEQATIRGEQLDEEIASLREQLENARTQRDKLEEERDLLVRQRDLSEKEIGQVSSRGEELEQELTSLREQLEAADAQRVSLEEARDALTEQRDLLIQQRDDNAREYGAITNRCETLAAEIEELRERCDDLTIQRDEAAEQRDHAIMQRDQFATERNELANQHTETTTLASETDEKYTELQKEYATLRDQYEVAIQTNQQRLEQADSHEANVKRLEKELQSTTLQVQTLQSEHDDLLEQLDERTARIQAAIDGRVTAETALSQMEAQIESLEEELTQSGRLRSEHEQKLQEIHASTEEMRVQAHELSEKLSGKDKRIEELQARIGEQEEAINRHRAEIQRLHSFRPEFEKLKENVAQKSAALAKAGAELQTRRSVEAQLKNELEQRDERITVFTVEQQTVRQQIAEQTEVIGKLRRELHDATAKLETAKQYQPQAVALQKKAETLQVVESDLRKQLQNVSSELDASLDANASMQDRIRQIESQLHENAVAMRDLRRKRANVPALGAASQNEQRKAA
ncbi:chromosome segregation ATPase [Rhodopirellula rubra]|uniref:Chromosome segregation ATPase n=1 Tax=Aporhodopirellula rubra TaxID=980271 RepID=A0A7W5DY08_9BACT|nr:hypothetical protein [Aporhodopirellula rubra]MBB3206598.1 chromosome segregation ATPase [Aporhodopirellula rubra]